MRICIFVPIALLLSGCVSYKELDEGIVEVGYKLYVPFMWGLVGLLLLWLGWSGIKIRPYKFQKLCTSITQLLGALMMFTLAVPGAVLDKVTISNSGFSSNRFFFSSQSYEFKYEEMASLQFVESKEKSKTSTDFIYELKNGSTGKMPTGSLLRAGAPAIVLLSSLKGVDAKIETLDAIGAGNGAKARAEQPASDNSSLEAEIEDLENIYPLVNKNSDKVNLWLESGQCILNWQVANLAKIDDIQAKLYTSDYPAAKTKGIEEQEETYDVSREQISMLIRALADHPINRPALRDGTDGPRSKTTCEGGLTGTISLNVFYGSRNLVCDNIDLYNKLIELADSIGTHNCSL